MIDKDIEKVKELLEAGKKLLPPFIDNGFLVGNEKRIEEENQAIENVLKELEAKSFQVCISKEELDEAFKELEKYKNENKELKEQIKDLRALNVQHLAKGLNESIANKKKNDEQLESLNEGWKITEKELKEEIYTYKKMTEYFAVKLFDLANEKMKEEYTTAQECCEYAKLRDICVRDMINSARNEVEKDGNN